MSQSSTADERSDDESSDETPSSSPGRQVARRVFATEFDQTHCVVQEDGDQSPRFAVLPTGQTANRIFIVGTLTEVADKGSDTEYYQARVVGPTGTFLVYAGQYQPEAQQFLRDVEPPRYVAVVAKPGDPYEVDDGQNNVPLNIEEINRTDAQTRDRWVNETAERTLGRIDAFDPDEPEAPADKAHLTTEEGFHPDPDLPELREEVVNAVRDVHTGDTGEAESEGTEAEEAGGSGNLRDHLRSEVGLRDAGNGADRDDVIAGVAEKHDVDVERVEAEIEAAIADGDFQELEDGTTIRSAE